MLFVDVLVNGLRVETARPKALDPWPIGFRINSKDSAAIRSLPGQWTAGWRLRLPSRTFGRRRCDERAE
jgi:hypothetical protein